MKLNRRIFLRTSAAAAGALAAPAVLADGHGKPRVVVVGGGAGGATAARYIAKDSKGEIDVTLIEPTRTYYTCFFSNLYLGGFKEVSDIGHTYGAMAASGVNVVHDWAIGVDRDAKTVSLAGGASVPYDKLILSPGIDFVDGAVEGWDLSAQNAMPHAYKAGSQSELLKAQLTADARRRNLCHGRTTQSVPLPTGTLRAHFDGCAFPEEQQSVRKDHRRGPQAKVLENGAVPGRVGKSL